MLNTRYIILPGGEGNEEIQVKNPAANGNAWFVKSVRFVANADSEIVGLYQVDTKTQAIAQQKFKEELQLKNTYEGEGTILLKTYQPNYLAYESDTKTDEFAVFSEIYYTYGWNAYVDGQLKPHAGVNYVLRGLPVPAGKHKIEFKFEPQTYKTGNSIALAGSIVLLLTIGISIYMDRRNNVIVS